jgi:hypothetical protein
MLYIDDASWFLKLIKQLVFAIVISLMLKMPIEFTEFNYQKSNKRIQGVRVCSKVEKLQLSEKSRRYSAPKVMSITAKQIHLITDASMYGLGGCYPF